MCRYMFARVGPTGMSVVWVGRTIAHGSTDLPAWDGTGGGDCGAATGHNIPTGSDLLGGLVQEAQTDSLSAPGAEDEGMCNVPGRMQRIRCLVG